MLNLDIFFLEVVDHLIVACPNITALHIGFKYYQYVQSQHLINNINVLSVIQFHCLSSLTLDGFELKDGSYLSSVRLILYFLLKLFLLKSHFYLNRSLNSAQNWRFYILATNLILACFYPILGNAYQMQKIFVI